MAEFSAKRQTLIILFFRVLKSARMNRRTLRLTAVLPQNRLERTKRQEHEQRRRSRHLRRNVLPKRSDVKREERHRTQSNFRLGKEISQGRRRRTKYPVRAAVKINMADAAAAAHGILGRRRRRRERVRLQEAIYVAPSLPTSLVKEMPSGFWLSRRKAKD